jgi:hypothetical protein
MAIKISGAGSSGNNDERTAERSGRSGLVIQPWWNIVASAAIRTGTTAFDRLVPAGPGRVVGAHRAAISCPSRAPPRRPSPGRWRAGPRRSPRASPPRGPQARGRSTPRHAQRRGRRRRPRRSARTGGSPRRWRERAAARPPARRTPARGPTCAGRSARRWRAGTGARRGPSPSTAATLLTTAGMPATAETRFVRSAGLSLSRKGPSDRGPRPPPADSRKR